MEYIKLMWAEMAFSTLGQYTEVVRKGNNYTENAYYLIKSEWNSQGCQLIGLHSFMFGFFPSIVERKGGKASTACSLDIACFY